MPIFCASAQKNDFKEMYSLNCHFANQLAILLAWKGLEIQ